MDLKAKRNEENMPPFSFEYKVDISTLNSLAKDVTDFFVELIEEADEFFYYQSYSGKNTTTYWYFCSQRCNLASKSKKHQDISKYHDAKAIERFKYDRTIKISIDNLNNMVNLSIKHDFLHQRPANVGVFQDIKDYIKEHIDLLPREIYAQLVSKGLDLSIHQKQIHF
ncbi:hypothetical protein RclHR1_07340004 [Rhizophagus clarus]|uniref:Uncharacterized protein n=1 Tax=Rhizophagus clarus TaxID=94130 RepID=A0A2Z6RVW7_9GLOM|nr:hypothetical protein RclHR1_07340004 [Rhizophagus clarus]